MRPLVLASASQVRRRLLQAAGITFEAVVSGVDEGEMKRALLARGCGAAEIALALAQAKALAINPGATSVVIGADQTLEFEGVLFDKTQNLEETREVLRRLRGQSFDLHCGVVLVEDGMVIWRSLTSPRLKMRAFSDSFLDAYLERNRKALTSSLGGFELEGEGAQLFDSVCGDYFSVLGLPLIELLAALRTAEAAPC